MGSPHRRRSCRQQAQWERGEGPEAGGFPAACAGLGAGRRRPGGTHAECASRAQGCRLQERLRELCGRPTFVSQSFWPLWSLLLEIVSQNPLGWKRPKYLKPSSPGVKVGLDDQKGLFQSSGFYDSMIIASLHHAAFSLPKFANRCLIGAFIYLCILKSS